MEHLRQHKETAPYEKERAIVAEIKQRIKELDIIIHSIHVAGIQTNRELTSSLRNQETEIEGIGQLLDDTKRDEGTPTEDGFSVDIEALERLYNERFAETEEMRRFVGEGKHLLFPTQETSKTYHQGHKEASDDVEESGKRSLFSGVGEQPPAHIKGLVARLETLGISWEDLRAALYAYGSHPRGNDNWGMEDVLGEFRKKLERELHEARLAVPSEVREMKEEVRELAQEQLTRAERSLKDEIIMRHGTGEITAEQVYRILKESGWVAKAPQQYPDEIKAVYFDKLLEVGLEDKAHITDGAGLRIVEVETFNQVKSKYDEQENIRVNYVALVQALRREIDALDRLAKESISLTFVPYDLKEGEVVLHSEYTTFDAKAPWPVLNRETAENPFVLERWKALVRRVESTLSQQYGYDATTYQSISAQVVRELIKTELETLLQSDELKSSIEATQKLEKQLRTLKERIELPVAVRS